jgi:hypothetical protein
MKKVLLTTVMSLMMCMGVYAQDYLNPPKAKETVIGTVSLEKSVTRNSTDGRKYEWYLELLEKAKRDFPNKAVDIRDMQGVPQTGQYQDWFYAPVSGKVVVDKAEYIKDILPQALNKALRNVHEGSRLAIDQVTVTSSMDREALKDQLLDVLLDKGYRVVAKDYLEKLYDEIKDWESGIYNENTTGKENNFSAVGYYINVKVTETSLRVQVVNVSTGEYEGNATVNF